MFESIILASVLNSVSTSWEDPSVLGYFGTYGDVGVVEYSSDEAYSGSYSLMMTEEGGGTPQVYVAYITGLEAGDTVDASAWFLGFDGNGDGGFSGGRLWGHYFDGSDLSSYAGSASGPSDIVGRDGGGWADTSHTWTIAEGQTALIIEARIYAYDGGADDRVWMDDLIVSSSNANASIFVGGVAIPAPGALALLGLAGFGRRRRNG